VNIAGRILAVHVDVQNDQRVYAGAAGGGLWISPNGGTSWSRSESFSGSAAVSAIAQSSDGTLYIGTGEGFGLSTYSMNTTPPGAVANNYPYGIKGDGVYKSTDRGQTFVRLPDTDQWTDVNAIAYDDKNNKLYVATNQGLKISTDGGQTFANAANISAVRGASVKVGSDGTVIYSDYSGVGDVYVSTNDGVTFTSVCGSDLPNLPNDNAGRISVDIAPSDPKVMYAMTTDNDGYFTGVYVSKDKGQNWRLVLPANSVNQDPMGRGGNWGTFCNAIAVSPTDPTQVLVGGARLLRGDEWDPAQNYNWVAIGVSPYLHTIYYANNNVAYLGTNTGVNAVTITGNSASVVECNNNLTTLQAYTIGVSNRGNLMTGTRDNGVVFIEDPNGPAKRGKNLEFKYADGADCIFSMVKSDALFYSGAYGFCYRQASFISSPQEPLQWMGGSQINAGSLPGSYYYVNIINKRGGNSNFDSPFQTEHTRWHYSSNSRQNLSEITAGYANRYVSPLAIWESVDDQNSTDTIMFIADKTYKPGDTICAKSKQNGYPIWIKYTGTDTLKRNADTLYIKDVVTSRLFIGGSGSRVLGGASVFMTTQALNFIDPSPFVRVFCTKDTTEQVMKMLPTKDGNHLFILTKRSSGSANAYSIYRVSGFDMARTPEEMDVSEAISDNLKGFNDPNPQRGLVDNVVKDDLFDDVLDIALDPQNNNTLIYTTNNQFVGKVNVITDALIATGGTATVESKDGTGLPPDIIVYCAIVEMSGSDTAYIGTEEGVYKTTNFTSSSPTWELCNEGINAKVPVFKLYQQTNYVPNNRAVYYDAQEKETYMDFQGVTNYGVIYAATYGLGIFVNNSHWNAIPEPFFPTGRNENMKINVYPNPATSSMTVDFTIAATNEVQISISDVMGRVVSTKHLGTKMMGNHQENIDCSALADGFYFVTINAGYQNQTTKIIINKK
ncbi:MAG: T9SS type A sorting domain-containing protein, partial [Lentimicrobiaceae bacterium]|nr:T9SS type A sorting domain-containing protein [Lentimicrobiaceae bacterium]